jgi:hypothetical protein
VGVREVSLWPRRPYRKSVSNKHGQVLRSRQNELKRGKHHILFDCGIEAGQFQSRIDAVEKVTSLSRMKYRGYIPVRLFRTKKVSRHDKLLLVFDAYTLSLAPGNCITECGVPCKPLLVHASQHRHHHIRIVVDVDFTLVVVETMQAAHVLLQSTFPRNRHCKKKCIKTGVVKSLAEVTSGR